MGALRIRWHQSIWDDWFNYRHNFSISFMLLRPSNRTSPWCNASWLWWEDGSENGCYPHITVDRVSFIATIMVHKHDIKVYKNCVQLFLLLASISAEWNHHGRSGRTLSSFCNPSFTLRHIMQSQHRIDQFWPFSELYSVCGRYLQSLTTKGQRERGIRKKWGVVVDWKAMSGLDM